MSVSVSTFSDGKNATEPVPRLEYVSGMLFGTGLEYISGMICGEGNAMMVPKNIMRKTMNGRMMIRIRSSREYWRDSWMNGSVATTKNRRLRVWTDSHRIYPIVQHGVHPLHQSSQGILVVVSDPAKMFHIKVRSSFAKRKQAMNEMDETPIFKIHLHGQCARVLDWRE